MAKYLIIGFSARFSGGVIGLTPEQALERSHNLEALGDDRFAILRPIEFRAGEVVDFEGEVHPLLLQSMAPAGDPLGAAGAEVALGDLTKKEIIALALVEGLTLDGAKNKATLILGLQEHRAQAAEAAKAARILELEALGDDLTDEQLAEYLEMKG
jgi:hypothetical protein